MSGNRSVVATDGAVAEAADAALRKGNPCDAVAAGVFAACALHGSVLLGPVQFLVLGTGGAQAYDGRVVQPGVGAKRPRGFLPDEPVPDAARVGASRFAVTVTAALATHGTMSLSTAMSGALAIAEAERKLPLARIAARGPLALAEDSILKELMAYVGPLGHGALTQDDLQTVRPGIEPAAVERRGDVEVTYVPWAPAMAVTSRTHLVAAADSRGRGAVACFEVATHGVPIPALGLLAPLGATPVLRGVARELPGSPIGCAAPIGARLRAGALELLGGWSGGGAGEHPFADLLQWMEITGSLASATTDAKTPGGAGSRGLALVLGAKGVEVFGANAVDSAAAGRPDAP